MPKLLTAFALLIALTMPAAAQHAHGSTGPNGGTMEDIAGVHAELVAAGSSLTFNILDEASKPVPVAGYTGSVLVVTGSQRETATLAVNGPSALGAALKAPVAAGTQVTLMLKTTGGKSGQARFKLAK